MGYDRTCHRQTAPHLIHCQDIVCDTPFFKVSDDFSNAQTFGEYVVSSGDLDTSNHMNNVQYVRAVMGAFSSETLASMPVKEIEVAYRHQCYEKEHLTFKIRENETGCDIGVIKDDGNTAATIRMIYK